MILDRRLVSADMLKLRRRPVTLVSNLLLALGFVAFICLAQHGAHYSDSVAFLLSIAVVVGANIGSMSGSQDRAAGILRDLVATGRSRAALYLSRVAAAGIVSLLLVVPAIALSIVLSQTVWGSANAPGFDQLIPGVLAGLIGALLGAAGGVGLSALLSSRAVVGSTLITWYLVISPLLENVKALGDARGLLPSLALRRIGDVPGLNLQISLAAASGVVLLWAAAPLVLGAWRENRREI